MKEKDNIKDYKKKLSILEDAKKIVIKDGWSKNLLKKLLSNKVKSPDLNYFFPNNLITNITY